MEYAIEWLEAPWLLNLSVQGEMTVDGFNAQIRDVLRYMDGADGHLYWLSDLSQIGNDSSTSGLDPKVIQAMLDTPMLKHPNCGQLVMVGDKLVRFISQMIAQSPEMKKLAGGVPMRVFGTFEEAEQFCREVATVDPHRATKCDPKPAASETPGAEDAENKNGKDQG